MNTYLWHSAYRAKVPPRRGAEITPLKQEPELPSLGKPEIPLPNRCCSAAPSPASGTGTTPSRGECRQTDRQTQEAGTSLAMGAGRFLPSPIGFFPLLGFRGIAFKAILPLLAAAGERVDADPLCRKLGCPGLVFQRSSPL